MRPEPSDLTLLLETERRLILTGDWSGLQSLAPRKAALLDRLPPGAPLPPLATALARNQALLAAAIDGLRDALGRRAALEAARRGLATYDPSGLRAALAAPSPRYERKA
ncbi:flagellar protein FlgN [Rubellimicrobium roseum]|uniref:Flagellar protein FlgN n=1 Tax=Rubellimicrobium roseum TaxID=687525 RepID=A0A5C4NM88_9RHOB|nr:flagellar protein FlgN [Rubellimicrobium roseum]TNC74226.1 flagellar protein FlgN [Rubellimicrobium roseum]